jgi:Tol biopolymer transport system component
MPPTSDTVFQPSVSAEGRFVAFTSSASWLNHRWDIFLHDRLTCMTVRVSTGLAGVQPNGLSSFPDLSDDARFVAFQSDASNLVAGDSNEVTDVFVYDTRTGTTERVSVGVAGVQGNAGSYRPAVSADGRFVAFRSDASNLVPGDTNGASDVFVRDRLNGVTTRISVGTGGVEANAGPSSESGPAISGDGQIAAFVSGATNLDPGDTDRSDDVYLHDRSTSTTTLVSASIPGASKDGGSTEPAIDAGGNAVVFTSHSSALVEGDTNNAADVFVYIRPWGVTRRVSIGPGGVQADGYSYASAISGNGRFITFASVANNLTQDAPGNYGGVFLFDRLTGVTTRIDVSTWGVPGDDSSWPGSVSFDGEVVVFQSYATNFDVPFGYDSCFVYVRDRMAVPELHLPASDFDGDGRSDVAVFRPATGVWYIIRSATGIPLARQWGIAGDAPVPGDYDGDGKADLAVYRPLTRAWFILPSAGTPVKVTWGLAGDLPVPADYDGDGTTDVAVFRPSTGTWYVIRSSTGTAFSRAWGQPGDVPVPADYDADGTADFGFFRPSAGRWSVLGRTGPFSVRWGRATDIPMAGDFDGDGRADPTVYRPSERAWYVRRTGSGDAIRVNWGASLDIPVLGDYDGDGRVDPTVFRGSTGRWYELRSLTGTGVGVSWGQPGDVPR